MDQTPVRLVGSDPAWPAVYEAIRSELRDALGERAHEMAHVGSTAVAGLAAKPTVDIAVYVGDIGRATDCLPALTRRGFAVGHRHEDWIYCRREADGDGTDVNCHLFADRTRFDDGVAFRDALRADPPTRRAYERLKRRLADRHRHDAVAYARGKSAFVEAVLDGARPPDTEAIDADTQQRDRSRHRHGRGDDAAVGDRRDRSRRPRR